MTKDEMVALLRSVGVNENTVTAMSNAYELGAEYERDACAKVADEHGYYGVSIAKDIRKRGNA